MIRFSRPLTRARVKELADMTHVEEADDDSEDSIETAYQRVVKAKELRARGMDYPVCRHKVSRSAPVDWPQKIVEPTIPEKRVGTLRGKALVGMSVSSLRPTKLERYERQPNRSGKLPVAWPRATQSRLVPRRTQSINYTGQYIEAQREMDLLSRADLRDASRTFSVLAAKRRRAMANEDPDWAQAALMGVAAPTPTDLANTARIRSGFMALNDMNVV
jgi:hypothetical protein